MKQNRQTLSNFYCTKCGKKGIGIIRQPNLRREAGHLKKLYCVYCNKETNHVECRGFGRYNYDSFLIEFNNGNFDEEGNRIEPSFKKFISNVFKEKNKNER